jgi:hypothetical protein
VRACAEFEAPPPRRGLIVRLIAKVGIVCGSRSAGVSGGNAGLELAIVVGANSVSGNGALAVGTDWRPVFGLQSLSTVKVRKSESPKVHIKHWANGGATALSNLMLLCSTHHTLLHEGGCRVEFDGAMAGIFSIIGSCLAW